MASQVSPLKAKEHPQVTAPLPSQQHVYPLQLATGVLGTPLSCVWAVAWSGKHRQYCDDGPPLVVGRIS